MEWRIRGVEPGGGASLG